MKSQILTFLTFLFLTSNVSTQTFEDCANAFQICDMQTLNFDFAQGVGNVIDYEGICDNGIFSVTEEFNSTWLEWQIATAGNFYFTITSDIEDTDLDFYVFRKTEAEDCDNKTVVRCMSSGVSVGLPSDNCIGPTGLSPDETDTDEFAGCNGDDNNFVAALDCLPGESYALAISNFSSDNAGFKIEFFGSATLDCSSSSVNSESEFIRNLEAIPNPAQAVTNFNFTLSKALTVSLSIFDATGQLMTSVFENERLLEGNYSERFETNQLSNGLYFYTLKTEGGVLTKRFVVEK